MLQYLQQLPFIPASASLHIPRVRCNVPSARAHILLRFVTKSLILESVSVLYARNSSVLIVWGTIRYPLVTPNTGVTTAKGSIIPACVLLIYIQHTDSTTPAQSEAPKQQRNTLPQQPSDTPQPREQRSATSQPQPITPPNTSNDSSSLSVTIPLQQSVCLLKTAIGTIVHDSRNVEAKILLDEGSQRSFVTEDLVKSLGLQPYSQERINISSFGSTCPSSRTLDTVIVNLLTKSGETLQLSVLVVPFIATPLQNTCHVSVANLPYLHDLQLALPFISEPEFKISLLVGADHYWDIVGDHGNGPTAVASKLGYLLSGPIQPVSQSTTTNVMMVTNSSNDDLDLKRFWDLESVGVSLTDETAQDNMLQLYLDSCLTRDADGAYTARFPWKSTHPVLPTNIAIA